MGRFAAIICTVAVGGLIALQPPANAALARHVGDLGAALVSASITLLTVGALLLLLGEPGRLSGLTAFKPEYAIGGVAGALIVVVGLIAVRPLGAGALTALLVAAQLIVAVVADRYRWFGLHHVGLGAGRISGLALVIVGTVLVTRG